MCGSTPASISSAAIWWAAGVVFSYMNRPVSVTRPTYSAFAISGVISASSSLAIRHTISAVDDADRADEVHGAEARVVVMVVDVEDVQAVGLEEVDRHAVDVAAVEEDDRALRDVLRRRAITSPS